MEKKEKAPAHFSSKVMPVPLQLTGNGQQEKLNKEMGCCLLPAWAFDHLQRPYLHILSHWRSVST